MMEVEERCQLCGRMLVPGPSINKHHLIPKTFGGRETIWLHVTCHTKIHAVFRERELLQEYNTIERIASHPEIQKFVKWVRRKPPEFKTRHRASKRKRGG